MLNYSINVAITTACLSVIESHFCDVTNEVFVADLDSQRIMVAPNFKPDLSFFFSPQGDRIVLTKSLAWKLKVRSFRCKRRCPKVQFMFFTHKVLPS